MTRPLITLLTDFGSADHYVAAMKGVILGICPEANIIDISHEVNPYDMTGAAFTLAQAWKSFPPRTVHLVVVDPGVGSARRPVVAEAGGHLFVGPDNGVFSMAFHRCGEYSVREITAREFFRQPVSRTFHGRDVFAPVTARLATGVAIEAIGEVIEDWVRLPPWSPVQTGPDTWEGTILKVDRFGNLITSFESADWTQLGERAFEFSVGAARITGFAASYAEGEAVELFVIAGSAGYLEISASQNNAAELTGMSSGSVVGLRLKQVVDTRVAKPHSTST